MTRVLLGHAVVIMIRNGSYAASVCSRHDRPSVACVIETAEVAKFMHGNALEVNRDRREEAGEGRCSERELVSVENHVVVDDVRRRRVDARQSTRQRV